MVHFVLKIIKKVTKTSENIVANFFFVLKDAQCFATYAKIISQILFFEKWSILNSEMLIILLIIISPTIQTCGESHT